MVTTRSGSQTPGRTRDDAAKSNKARMVTTNTAQGAFKSLHSMPDNELPYQQLGKLIDAEDVSEYVKNLLFFLLSVYRAQLVNKENKKLVEPKTLISAYDDKDIWRSFFMLDSVQIPDEALKYLGPLFLVPSFQDEDAQHLRLRLEVHKFIGHLRNAYYDLGRLRHEKRLVPATRHIIDDNGYLFEESPSRKLSQM